MSSLFGGLNSNVSAVLDFSNMQLHTRLDELLNGSEDGSTNHMPSGLPKEDCTWCVKSKSRGLSCSPDKPAPSSGGACSTDIPTHSCESSHSSDSPVPTGREECHSDGLNGLMIKHDSLQRNSTPVLHGMNSTHAYSTSNGCDSVLQLLETDGTYVHAISVCTCLPVSNSTVFIE